MWINLGPEYLRGTQLLQITPCYSAMDCSLFCARRISRMHASESFTAMSWFWPSHLKAKNWVSYAPQGVAFVRHGWPQLLISQQIWTAHNNTGQHGTARDRPGRLWTEPLKSPEVVNLFELFPQILVDAYRFLAFWKHLRQLGSHLGSVVDSEVPSCRYFQEWKVLKVAWRHLRYRDSWHHKQISFHRQTDLDTTMTMHPFIQLFQ